MIFFLSTSAFYSKNFQTPKHNISILQKIGTNIFGIGFVYMRLNVSRVMFWFLDKIYSCRYVSFLRFFDCVSVYLPLRLNWQKKILARFVVWIVPVYRPKYVFPEFKNLFYATFICISLSFWCVYICYIRLFLTHITTYISFSKSIYPAFISSKNSFIFRLNTTLTHPSSSKTHMYE